MVPYATLIDQAEVSALSGLHLTEEEFKFPIHVVEIELDFRRAGRACRGNVPQESVERVVEGVVHVEVVMDGKRRGWWSWMKLAASGPDEFTGYVWRVGAMCCYEAADKAFGSKLDVTGGDVVVWSMFAGSVVFGDVVLNCSIVAGTVRVLQGKVESCG